MEHLGDVIRTLRRSADNASAGSQYAFSSYDRLGRPVAVRDTGGHNGPYRYEMVGNRLSASDPDLGKWSYQCDAANRLVKQTDARGTVTTMRYDQGVATTAKVASGRRTSAGGRSRQSQQMDHLYQLGQRKQSQPWMIASDPVRTEASFTLILLPQPAQSRLRADYPALHGSAAHGASSPFRTDPWSKMTERDPHSAA